MHIILDKVDDALYGDIVLSSKELEQMQYGEMIHGCVIFQKKRCYLGVRLQGLWDEEESEQVQEEDF